MRSRILKYLIIRKSSRKRRIFTLLACLSTFLLSWLVFGSSLWWVVALHHGNQEENGTFTPCMERNMHGKHFASIFLCPEAIILLCIQTIVSVISTLMYGILFIRMFKTKRRTGTIKYFWKRRNTGEWRAKGKGETGLGYD